MIACGEKVREYTKGLNQEAFFADKLTYDATLHNLGLISGAAAHIPKAMREIHPDINWREIIGLRNSLIQDYRNIDDTMLWATIKGTVSVQLSALRSLLNKAHKDA